MDQKPKQVHSNYLVFCTVIHFQLMAIRTSFHFSESLTKCIGMKNGNPVLCEYKQVKFCLSIVFCL